MARHRVKGASSLCMAQRSWGDRTRRRAPAPPNTSVASPQEYSAGAARGPTSGAPQGAGSARALALGVLRGLAGALEAVFLALLHTRVAREEAGVPQLR